MEIKKQDLVQVLAEHQSLKAYFTNLEVFFSTNIGYPQ
jgi:hypothetical protein